MSLAGTLSHDSFQLLTALVAVADARRDAPASEQAALARTAREAVERASVAGTDGAARETGDGTGCLDLCREQGFVSGSAEAPSITDAGREALEPYRARRAVLMAAGFGSRMVPITLNTPKPLVRVHGKRIIDTIIDALLAAGIDEIYLVRGYLGEQFDQLLYTYPGLHFIDNPLFDSTNNISSAVAAADHFQNAYAFESDLLLRDPGLITPYQYSSNYLGVPVDETPDWCFTVEDGIIRDLRKGGTHCHHMFGVSYWDAESGRRLAEDLPRVFAQEDGRDIFWDDVPIVRCPDDFTVRIRECSFEDISEIDSFAELQDIDPLYRL